MKRLLSISVIGLVAFSLMGGCTGGEDTSVKEAPAEIETKTAAEMGGGRVKGGEGGGGGERESRAGG